MTKPTRGDTLSLDSCHYKVSPTDGTTSVIYFCGESKSTHLTFTLRRDPSPPIYLNNVEIPPATNVKYLGLLLDNTLNWKEHIKKRKQMELRHKELYWLLGRSSPLSVGNTIVLYKSLFTPTWTNGIEL